jgi:prevent-host-death family protein
MYVAIRELKSSLSRVLALAQGGEVIEVTSHSKPIARIVGIPPQTDEGLRRLMASGILTWNGSKPKFVPAQALVPGGKPMGQMVLEDRG